MTDPIPFEPAPDDVAFAAGMDAEVASRNRNRRGRAGSGTQAGSESQPHLGAASARQTPYGSGGRAQGTPLQRSLPHSVEAEECFLSCCFLESGAESIGQAFGSGVREGSFYVPAHGFVWAAIEKFWREQKSVDVAVVAEWLREKGQLEQVGGYAFLTQVTQYQPTSFLAGHWLAKVLELAERRLIIREATAAVEKAFEVSGEGVGNDRPLIAALDRLQEVRVRSQRDLPAIVRDEELEAMALPEPPMLIDKVLHRGRRTLLLAPSKASKTWTAMHMSAAIASGSPWLGFRTHQAPVLHIDLELPTWDLKKRRNKLKELLGLTRPLDVDWWSLDGYQRSIDELLPLIVARAPLGKFGLIVIEPAYVILGKRDENDNADVTDFMNRLAWIARLTGAAVLCTHHFAKGDASKKEAKDRASGAGAWVRAPDTAITLTPLDEGQGADCYSMEFIERSMKRHPAVGVQFEYPVFRTREGLDLNALREAGRPRESTEKDVVRALGEDSLTHGQWMKAAGVGKEGQMSERTFNRRIKEAIDSGLVTQNGPIYRAAAKQ